MLCKICLSKQAKKPRKQAKKNTFTKIYFKNHFAKSALQNLLLRNLTSIPQNQKKEIKNLQTIKISKNFHTF